MKIYEGGEIAPPFFTRAIDGSEWPASRPVRFILVEIASGTHWTGGWVGPRGGLNAVEYIENLLHLPGIELRPFIPSLYGLSYPGSIVQIYASQ
jgi:hypothetical protein